jgi:CheY-like chemotaxis protein
MARILVADDEELVRASLAVVLRRAGHVVALAADGEDALRKFGSNRYDLVITDIVMPRMEGIETVRALRRLEPGVRIIAMSGRGSDGGFYLKAAIALGADATLQKPFRASELRHMVEEVLAMPRSSSEILWYRQVERRTLDPTGAALKLPLARKSELPIAETRFRGNEGRTVQPGRLDRYGRSA